MLLQLEPHFTCTVIWKKGQRKMLTLSYLLAGAALGFHEPKLKCIQEFENNEGEDGTTEFSVQGSPNSQNGPEVYILPLTEVSLPVSKQPGRSVQFLKSTDLGRHSLLYLKEIGHGWFGKVLLGEVNAGLSTTQVVVKELKVSASVQDQMQFLEEAQPYRALQHLNLLQCLAQCTEVTPYLLVMEFCPLGDLKGYLRSCRSADSMAPDPLSLQRMACEIASGLTHLHKHNYIHSDLALRNCFLTADLTVKIGDYGLSHSKYKDDYFVTTDQLWVPLRWIAPELIDDVHGNLLVVDQTKPSNIWSLGVTIWELFELGNQPYRHYSDRQVLTYAIKEQQLKLPKPQLKLPLVERWYEVMQFCWLQPEQRPIADEVHLLLSYLCAKGASEAEEEFEKRWNSMKPNGSGTCHGTEVSSFPLLEQFSNDGFQSDGDDILTVTETSHGLNFEYKWEHAKSEHFQTSSGALGQGNSHYEDIYYPTSSAGRLSLGVSPSYYDCKQQSSQSLHTPGVVPILSAHSPSVSSEYYIRIEEPSESNLELDYTMCSYSPEYDRSSQIETSYWHGSETKSNVYDSDNSPAISLTMEPLLGQVSSKNSDSWEKSQLYGYNRRNSQQKYEPSPTDGDDQYLFEDASQNSEEPSVGNLRKSFISDPLGVSPSVSCTFRDSSPELTNSFNELNETPLTAKPFGQRMRKTTSGYFHNFTKPTGEFISSVDIQIEADSAHEMSEQPGEESGSDLLTDDARILAQKEHWTSNKSSNNNSISCAIQTYDRLGNDAWCYRYMSSFKGLTSESDDIESLLSPELQDPTAVQSRSSLVYDSRSLRQEKYPLEGQDLTLKQDKNEVLPCEECNPKSLDQDCSGSPDSGCTLQQEATAVVDMTPKTAHDSQCVEFVDPLLGCVVGGCGCDDCTKLKQTGSKMEFATRSPSASSPSATKSTDLPEMVAAESLDTIQSESGNVEATHISQTKLNTSGTISLATVEVARNSEWPDLPVTAAKDQRQDNSCIQLEMPSEVVTSSSQQKSAQKVDTDFADKFDDSFGKTYSSVSFIEIDDCSDEDVTDITSGIFTDFTNDHSDVPSFKSLQKQAGTPDSLESLDIPSTASSCEVFSPTTYNATGQPKALDSGYDTENYESPEFVLKEPHEPREPEAFNQVNKSNNSSVPEAETVAAKIQISSSYSTELNDLDDKNPYRDSAYFSDYDAETDKYSREEQENNVPIFHIKREETFPDVLDQGFLYQTSENLNVSSEMKPIGESKEDGASDGTSLHISCEDSPVDSACVDFKQTSRAVSGELEKDNTYGLDASDEHVLAKQTEESIISSCPALSESGEVQDEGIHLEDNKKRHSSSLSGSSDAMFFYSSSMKNSNQGVGHSHNTKNELTLKEHDDIHDNEVLAGVSEVRTSKLDSMLNGQLAHQARKLNDVTCDVIQPPPKCCHIAEETLVECVISKPQTQLLALNLPLLNTHKELRHSSSDVGEEADEEDEDTEDSDESDEELCCYNIQEQSEESEEDFHAIPIVVSENNDGRNLRSLLKMPSLMSESFCEELDRKKKAVSFFDDVTVYLFDQESPTKELSDQSFPEVEQQSQQHLQDGNASSTNPPEKPSVSDDSSDGNVSEESSSEDGERE
nr:PREDICTED: serine/threonine-protein kinase LMTK1 isoform X2 [Latimeria chalumnae]|eukprot:XP_014350189.1 PREDICTED: serine/threonine-protein kinase LMTK1 isoform X2 [Latimeria chalumnae]